MMMNTLNDDILIGYLKDGAETTEDILYRHTGVEKRNDAYTYLSRDEYNQLRKEMNRIGRMLVRLEKHMWVERIGESPRRWRAL